MKKAILTLLIGLSASVTYGCWYTMSNYTDYIYSVNDEVIHEQTDSQVTRYTMHNNKVVDFPVTVSMKLISNDSIRLNNDSKTDSAGELIRGKLQYRVLPTGEWITASEYEATTGTIPKETPPATYFGKNNIYPKGCKKGDVIMIRLYVTDGMWQSGEMSSKCENKIGNVSTEYGTRRTIPNTISYDMDGTVLRYNDMGGGWYPHLVTTVVFSGNERPIR